MLNILWRTNRRSYFDLQNDIANLKTALAETTHDVKGRVGEILVQSLRDVRERSEDAKDSVAEYVSKKPFKSLGIAMIAGIIIGLFIRK